MKGNDGGGIDDCNDSLECSGEHGQVMIFLFFF